MLLSKSKRYDFGPFRLQVNEGLLYRGDQTVPLTPKAFELLAALVENRERVVTKEELLNTVWPDAFVEEGILAVNVATLRRVLTEKDGPSYIETVPKRGYRFVGRVTLPAVRPPWMRAGRWILGLALAVGACVAAWLRTEKTIVTPRVFSPVPLTSYPGAERSPTFSPGGDLVAFSWNGEKEDNFDIYARTVTSSGAPLRLTTHPAADRFPAWSPDGRYIAFERLGAVYLVPPHGGAERKLADFNTTHIAWTADSKAVAVSGWREGIFLIKVETGEKKRITAPTGEAWADQVFAFSPDGKELAFARLNTSNHTDLFLMPVFANGLTGEARKVLDLKTNTQRLAWAPDGNDLIYVDPGNTLEPSLARMPIKRPAVPSKQVEGVGSGIWEPVVVRDTPAGIAQLAYAQMQIDTNIWLKKHGSIAPIGIAASTRFDICPQLSPDETRVVFTSSRSGRFELWFSDVDGGNLVQLPSFGSGSNAPRWSPDGKAVAFSSTVDGNRDIYTVSASGGSLRRLTTERSSEGRPNWSRDGRSIYFYSTRTPEQQIFKALVEGGPATQVTLKGGHESFESTDGKTLYYINASSSKVRGRGLWSRPTSGQASAALEKPIEELAMVQEGWWGVTDRGIMFVDVDGAEASLGREPGRKTAISFHFDPYYSSFPHSYLPIKVFDVRTRRLTEVGRINKQVVRTNPGFAVSHDGQTILWAQIDRYESDLMLVENFR